MGRLFAKFFMAAALVCAVSCSGGKALLPNISGKAGEIVVVIDRDNWQGSLGNAVRDILGGDCPYLPIREPYFTLSNVTPTGFADIFKVHRNIIIFNINPQIQREEVAFVNDAWAQPQCVVQISAYTKENALTLLNDNKGKIVSAIEQAERDRIIRNCIKYENLSAGAAVTEMVGGSPHFLDGYQVLKNTGDFIWIAYNTNSILKDILVYKYPALGNEKDFDMRELINNRNRFLQANVPSTAEGSYMITDESIMAPTLEYIKFRGRQFAQMRGWWEVHGGWMGGPFVTHSFYSKDGKSIIVLDAFVHAPSVDKRQHLREVESIIYSFDWAKENED